LLYGGNDDEDLENQSDLNVNQQKAPHVPIIGGKKNQSGAGGLDRSNLHLSTAPNKTNYS
jgi:hypothetical protein